MKTFNLEKIFVILALFFGIFYILILPPFQSVDEGAHFFKAYEIASGNFKSKNINNSIGDFIPKDYFDFYCQYNSLIKNIEQKSNISLTLKSFKIKPNNKNLKFVEFPNTALYSPICYITQSPAILIGKTLNFSIGTIYYAGRLCNLLFYCLLIFFALKITPTLKLPMFLLALMPMSLSLASAYSSDVAVFGFNFLWVAIILKTLQEDICSRKHQVMFVFLAFLISLTKSYILLLPLIFLIPKTKFHTIKNYIGFILSVLLSAVIGLIAWSLSSKGLSLNMHPDIANPELQAIFIKTHPILYVGIILKTFIIKLPRIIITMVGVLGWQDTRLDWLTYILYPCLISIATTFESSKFTFQKWQKAILILTIFLGIVITFTSLYLMWSPVANNIILGLNGKYFIPLVLPLLLLINKKHTKFTYNMIKIFTIVAVILILFSSELSLLHRFYDITPQLYYKV